MNPNITRNFFKDMKNENKTVGAFGENAAEKFLIQKGYKIIAKNYRAKVDYRRYAEIDIIAELDEEIIFVEVKTRKTDQFGAASLAVGHKKKANIIAAAQCFIYENEEQYGGVTVAFDVIEVYPCPDKIKINHIRNAFIT